MAESGSDITTLVYKGCAKQAFTDPAGLYSQAISALFQTLVSQSMKLKFYKTTTGTAQTTINGLFQCRGDLTSNDCYNCVSQLPTLSDKLCGSKTIASRIQLHGCYMLYEVAGFAQISGMQMLFKTCGGGPGGAATNGGGNVFEEKRDTAFSFLENGVISNHGFFTANYQSVYVLGQCEGDVGDSDCGDCVRSAVQRAQDKCYITYAYYANGVPKRSPSSSSSFSHASSSSTGQETGKTVAIILGGAAGVGFAVILLMFARNAVKKHDGKSQILLPKSSIDASMLLKFFPFGCRLLKGFQT
ncbi:hypothetical protein V6N12_033493 [Hibiscus sabdariffa]|uniref:Gnk2-homologous domain-containing protein n=1 Tax=Hibiscus sabdariffa TaxID=183260 RepID=A0ABR2BVV0_9ROSI